MSIIYDALKKVEKSSNQEIITQVNKERTGTKLTSYLGYVLFACVGLFIANLLFGMLSQNKPAPAVTPKPQSENIQALPLKEAASGSTVNTQKSVAAPAKTATAAVVEVKKEPMIPHLSLNGVFYSKNEGYALINNRVVKQGDTIEGVKVKRVNLDNVELETSSGIKFKLSTQNR